MKRSYVELSGIPNLVMNASYFNQTKEITLEMLKLQIQTLKESSMNRDYELGLVASNYACSLNGYMKIHPLESVSIFDYEVPVVGSTLLHSPECSFILKSAHTIGLSSGLIESSGKSFAILYSFVIIVQLIATIIQMESYNTPTVN